MMKQDVEKAISTRIRPALQMDGGDVELVSVDEKTGVVKLALRGHCAHCAYAQTMTIKSVEDYLKQTVPGVKRVETVS